MKQLRILLIQGHPDQDEPHFGHALSKAYAEGAQARGHEVRVLHLASLDFPLLRSKRDWEAGSVPESLAPAQQDILWAQHIVLFFPLWLGGMPALVYRWYFRAHSVKALERNILGFVGIGPVHETLIGMVEGITDDDRARWLKKMAALGAKAA